MRGYSIFLCLPLLAIGCGKDTSTAQEAEFEPEVPKKPTVQSYINALQAGDVGARLTAAVGLGEMGRDAKPALPAMIVALRDTNKNVRTLIALSLTYVDPKGRRDSGATLRGDVG